MSDFVINFRLAEWAVERDGQDGGGREKERRHAEINERDTEEPEKSRNEARTIGPIVFRCSVLRKIWLLILSQSPNGAKPVSLLVLCHCEKRERWTLWFQQLCWPTCDPPISRSWCLVKDPAFTTSNNVFVWVVKSRRERHDKTSHHQAWMEAEIQKIQHSHWI